MKSIDRNSNIELLRLVCMFYILMHHFFVHALDIYEENRFLDVTLDILFYSAVNIFVLISGYFGIKQSLKGFINLYFQCAFYGTIGYILHLCLDGGNLGRSILYNSVLVFSNSPGWWFIQIYIFLYIISPILNKSIDYMSKTEHQWALIGLTVLNIYFGFFWSNNVNLDGYNLMQFIYLYFIGRYLNKYVTIHTSNKYRTNYFLLYLVSSIMLVGLYFINIKYMHSNFRLFNAGIYNNPFLIIAAVGFLLFFLSFSFKSRYINFMAVSALSIYLITENSYISKYFYAFILSQFQMFSNQFIQYLMLFVYAVLTLFSCVYIDKIRIFILTPIQTKTVKILQKGIDKFVGQSK